MRIEFVDGWPYRQPRLLVTGIVTEHTNNAGEVCLWEPGAKPRTWLTLQGVYDRIEEWVSAVGAGFPNDGVLDAHLYFDPNVRAGIATVELAKIVPRSRDAKGRIRGRWQHGGLLLELTSQGGEYPLDGRWYFATHVPSPPRNIDEVRALLTPSQAASLDAGLDAVARGKGDRLLLLVWETPNGTNALTLTQQRVDGNVEVKAIETAPTDREYLAARAGPDFDALQAKSALVFGVGALGSHISVRLAECGIGKLVLHDDDLLRPGNVVRHVARREQIGWAKPDATKKAIIERVPWTTVALAPATWNPDELGAALAAGDIVVDATGIAGFTDLLSDICRREKKPLVSVALYRAGSVGRVCRQAAPADTPIGERAVGQDARYPQIPRGDEPLKAEPGCSALVNNAPPTAVAAIATHAADVVIDALTGAFHYGDELIEVFRPLQTAPFHKIGTVRVDD